MKVIHLIGVVILALLSALNIFVYREDFWILFFNVIFFSIAFVVIVSYFTDKKEEPEKTEEEPPMYVIEPGPIKEETEKEDVRHKQT